MTHSRFIRPLAAASALLLIRTRLMCVYFHFYARAIIPSFVCIASTGSVENSTHFCVLSFQCWRYFYSNNTFIVLCRQAQRRTPHVLAINVSFAALFFIILRYVFFGNLTLRTHLRFYFLYGHTHTSIHMNVYAPLAICSVRLLRAPADVNTLPQLVRVDLEMCLVFSVL